MFVKNFMGSCSALFVSWYMELIYPIFICRVCSTKFWTGVYPGFLYAHVDLDVKGPVVEHSFLEVRGMFFEERGHDRIRAREAPSS